jgi:hypothetical protein
VSAATAQRLLSRFGTTITWRRPGARTVTAGVESNGAASTASVVGVVLPITDARDARFEPATVVRGEAAEILTAGTVATAPRPGDEYVASGATWKVIGVTTLAPAGVAMLYTAAVTR